MHAGNAFDGGSAPPDDRKHRDVNGRNASARQLPRDSFGLAAPGMRHQHRVTRMAVVSQDRACT